MAEQRRRIQATDGEEYTLIFGPGGLGGASPAPTNEIGYLPLAETFLYSAA
jgi:hypothetical protein